MVGSEEALSILLFLYENKNGFWSADDIRSTLRIDLDSTASSSTIVTKRVDLRLIDLLNRGLVRLDPHTRTYRFESSDPRHAQFLDQLLRNADDLEKAKRFIYIRPAARPSPPGAQFGRKGT
ncbi:MAG TPA: hypothetical protein VF057_01920 [Thermoanaerobaculia bacterium]